MSRSTVFLARSIGLFTILFVLGVLVRGNAIIEAMAADGPVMFSWAVISLAAGVAMIVGHNVWSGGALSVAVTVTVTVMGWLIFAKGILLLLLTPEGLTGWLAGMHYGEHTYLYLAPASGISLYLTWAGFMATFRADRAGVSGKGA